MASSSTRLSSYFLASWFTRSKSQFAPRYCNSVVDTLARHARTLESAIWLDDTPDVTDIVEQLALDLMNECVILIKLLNFYIIIIFWLKL